MGRVDAAGTEARCLGEATKEGHAFSDSLAGIENVAWNGINPEKDSWPH
jgi:hypothetical protein